MNLMPMSNDKTISSGKWFPAILGMAGLLFCAVNTVAAPILTAVTVSTQNPNPIQPGDAATYTVTSTRTGNGNMDVYLSTSGLPAGATAAFATNKLHYVSASPTDLSTTLTVSTTAAILPGTYYFTVMGDDGGSHNIKLATATLIVGGQSRSLPQSILSIDCTQQGSMHLLCAGASGQTYKIQATTDLGSGSWTDLGTVNADSSGTFTFTDYSATNYPARFYRTSSL